MALLGFWPRLSVFRLVATSPMNKDFMLQAIERIYEPGHKNICFISMTREASDQLLQEFYVLLRKLHPKGTTIVFGNQGRIDFKDEDHSATIVFDCLDKVHHGGLRGWTLDMVLIDEVVDLTDFEKAILSTQIPFGGSMLVEKF